MSVSDPNAQQLDKRAKKLIVPGEGHSFISIDASQIEYRLIVHYVNDPTAVAAYNADPWTDYHKYVQGLLGDCPRRVAKMVNFLLGFGGGRSLLIKKLSTLKDVVALLLPQVSVPPDDPAHAGMLAHLSAAYGERIYNTLHANMPGLRPSMKTAADSAAARGYARTLCRRRRHIGPPQVVDGRMRSWYYKAFNSAVQGTAADIFKIRFAQLSPWLRQTSRTRLVALVHDEFLFRCPSEDNTPEWRRELVERLTHAGGLPELRVPLRWSVGWSDENWSKCDQEAKIF